MKINFFATYRPLVGGKTMEFSLPEGTTIRQMLDSVIARYPKLRAELLDERGDLWPHVHVFVNGRDTQYLPAAMETPLTQDETINIFPPVAGG